MCNPCRKLAWNAIIYRKMSVKYATVVNFADGGRRRPGANGSSILVLETEASSLISASARRSQLPLDNARRFPHHLTGRRPGIETQLPLLGFLGGDDRFGEGLRSLLRQIVADAALDEAVLISPGEFAAIGCGVGMGRAVGVAFHGDRGHCDDGPLGEFLFQIVVFPLAVGEVEPPAIIVYHDGHVVRVVEGRRATVEGRVVEVPSGRGLPPDELRKVAPVFVVADSA